VCLQAGRDQAPHGFGLRWNPRSCEFVVYPDTPHAFNADYRPSYREGPAKDGWQRMMAWFKTHGVA